MAVLKAQVIYGWAGGTKPVLVGEGDDQKKLISHEDFSDSMRSAEESVGQGITQDNAEVLRQLDLISTNIPTSLDTGTATTADLAAAVNQIITILTNLNVTPKQ